MRTPRVAIVVESGTTIPLRFDDPEFIRAIQEDDDTPEGRGVLAQVMEAKKAGDVDFSPLVEDGWVLHVRPNIRIDERSTQYNAGQRAGGGLDLKEALRAMWATWVMGVQVADDLELSPKMAAMLKSLSSPNRKNREEAFGELPASTASMLMARLRAHVDTQGRPADRDPGQTAPKGPAADPSHATGSSWSGAHDLTSVADR